MNEIKLINLMVFLICIVGFNVYGQRKEISKENFFDSYRDAGTKTQKVTHRVVSKNEIFLDSEIQSLTTFTDEFVPPDRKRSIIEMKNFPPIINKYSLSEIILIGNDEYKRENGHEWTKQILPTTKQPAYNNTSKTVENNPKFYLTENVNCGNQTANLYEITVEYKHSTQATPTSEAKESISFRREKIWISREKLLLKMEMEDEFPGLRKSNSRRVWIYEYDPNIKIEAPVLKTENKN